MNRSFSALALAATLLVPVAACAQTQPAQPAQPGTSAEAPHRHRDGMNRFFKDLNLTDAQKAQIKTMMQSQRATMRPLMQQMAQNRLAMLNATASGAFDQAKVAAIANQQAQLMAQLSMQKAQLHSQIYNTVLTADQKAKADQLRQNQIARINQHLEKLSQNTAAETPAQ